MFAYKLGVKQIHIQNKTPCRKTYTVAKHKKCKYTTHNRQPSSKHRFPKTVDVLNNVVLSSANQMGVERCEQLRRWLNFFFSPKTSAQHSPYSANEWRFQNNWITYYQACVMWAAASPVIAHEATNNPAHWVYISEHAPEYLGRQRTKITVGTFTSTDTVKARAKRLPGYKLHRSQSILYKSGEWCFGVRRPEQPSFGQNALTSTV